MSKITPQSAAKASTRLDLTWLRFSTAAEGTPERALGEMLRRRGVGAVLRGLDIARETLAAWRLAAAVPVERSRSVVELHALLLAAPVPVATEQRLGVGKIDVEEAWRMRHAAPPAKIDAIAAHFGVTPQGVSKALAKEAKRRAAEAPDDAA